jgi:HTH-type transcriptional regulator/antitoxin HigA
MEIRPIKTEADYQAALEEIERLFDAAPDTPEGEPGIRRLLIV